jgi:CheY-like chemotaxis protein
MLVRLIDDLLDVARITRGKLVLRTQPTTLQEVLESAMETARPQLEQGNHPLRLDIPAAAIPLDADPMRLSQVFANLLNNAAKYSDAGSEILLQASPGDEVEVRVCDRGIGLDEVQSREIFELFIQADSAVDRARGGLGIGLTLVRQLVEMHGGVVQVHSEGPGRGSEFSVRLPLAAAGAPAAAAAADAMPERPREPVAQGATPARALVLDDNRDAADTLSMMLELLGMRVRTLYDPAEFDAAFTAFAPEVVFLDVGMPGRSGYDVAAALRAMPGGEDVLLVAVTGWGQPEDRRRTREAGFDQHLVKPPDLPAIQAICGRLAERDSAA